MERLAGRGHGSQQALSAVASHHVEVLGQLIVQSERASANPWRIRRYSGHRVGIIFHGHKHALSAAHSAHDHAPEVIQLVRRFLCLRVENGLGIGHMACIGRGGVLAVVGGQAVGGHTRGIDQSIGGKDIHIVLTEVDLHGIINAGHLPGSNHYRNGVTVVGAYSQILRRIFAPDIDRTIFRNGRGASAMGKDLDYLPGVVVAQASISGDVKHRPGHSLSTDIAGLMVQTQRASLIQAPSPNRAVPADSQSKIVARGNVHDIVHITAGSDGLHRLGLRDDRIAITLAYLGILVASPGIDLSHRVQSYAEVRSGGQLRHYQLTVPDHGHRGVSAAFRATLGYSGLILYVLCGIGNYLYLHKGVKVVIGLVDRDDGAAHTLPIEGTVFIHRDHLRIGAAKVEVKGSFGGFAVHIKPVDLRLELEISALAGSGFRCLDHHAMVDQLYSVLLIGGLITGVFKLHIQIQGVDFVGQGPEIPALVQRILPHGNVTQLAIGIVAPGKYTAVSGDGSGQAVLRAAAVVSGIAVHPDHSLQVIQLIDHCCVSIVRFAGQHFGVAGGGAAAQTDVAGTGGDHAIVRTLLTGVVGAHRQDLLVAGQGHDGVAAGDLPGLSRQLGIHAEARAGSTAAAGVDRTGLADGISAVGGAIELHDPVIGPGQVEGHQTAKVVPGDALALLGEGIELCLTCFQGTGVHIVNAGHLHISGGDYAFTGIGAVIGLLLLRPVNVDLLRVGSTPDEHIALLGHSHSVAFLRVPLRGIHIGAGIHIHDLNIVLLAVAVQGTQRGHHGGTGHIALSLDTVHLADAAVSDLTIAIAAPSIDQTLSVDRHSKIGAGGDLDDLRLMVRGGYLTGRDRNRLHNGLAVHIQHRIPVRIQDLLPIKLRAKLVHRVEQLVLQDHTAALVVKAVGYPVVVECHLLRFCLKAAHSGRAKAQNAIGVAAPGKHLAVGLQGQDIILTHRYLGIGHCLRTAVPVGIGRKDADPEFHRADLCRAVVGGDRGQDHRIASALGGDQTSGAHAGNGGIQAGVCDVILATGYALIQSHGPRRLGQQVKALGNGIVVRKIEGIVGSVQLQRGGVGLPLNDKAAVYLFDLVIGNDVLLAQLFQRTKAHGVHVAVFQHKVGMVTTGGRGGMEYVARVPDVGARTAEGAALLTVVDTARCDQTAGAVHHGQSAAAGNIGDIGPTAGGIGIGNGGQVLRTIGQSHTDIDRDADGIGSRHSAEGRAGVLAVVGAPGPGLAGGCLAQLDRSAACRLLHQEGDGHSVVLSRAHGQGTVLQKRIALDLLGGVRTSTDLILLVAAHALDRTVGLEEVSCGGVAGRDHCHHIAHTLQADGQAVVFILAVSQLLGLVGAHAKDVVAQGLALDRTAGIIPVGVDALDHQGIAVVRIDAAHCDVYDLLDIGLLVLVLREGRLLLSACQDLGGMGHTDGSFLTQTQLALIVPAPSPDGAIVLQRVDKAAGGGQLAYIVQVGDAVVGVSLLDLDRIGRGTVDCTHAQLTVVIGAPSPNGAVTRQGGVEAVARDYLRIGHAGLGGGSRVIGMLIHAAVHTDHVHTAVVGPDLDPDAGHRQRILGQGQKHVGNTRLQTGDDGPPVIGGIIHLSIVIGRDLTAGRPLGRGGIVVPHAPGQILIRQGVRGVVEHVEGGDPGINIHLIGLAHSHGDHVLLQHEVSRAHPHRDIAGCGGGVAQTAVAVLTVRPQGAVSLHYQRVLGLGGCGVEHRDHTLDMIAGIAGGTNGYHIGYAGDRLQGIAVQIHVVALAQARSGELRGLAVDNRVDLLILFGATHRPQGVVAVRHLQVFRNIHRHGEGHYAIDVLAGRIGLGVGILRIIQRRVIIGIAVIDGILALTIGGIDAVAPAHAQLVKCHRLLMEASGAVGLRVNGIGVGIQRIRAASPSLDLSIDGDGGGIVLAAAHRQGPSVEDRAVRLLLIGIAAVGVIAPLAPCNDLSIGPQQAHIGGDLIRRQHHAVAEDAVAGADVSGHTRVLALPQAGKQGIQQTVVVLAPAEQPSLGVNGEGVGPSVAHIVSAGGNVHNGRGIGVILAAQSVHSIGAQDGNSEEVSADIIAARTLTQFLAGVGAPGPDRTILGQGQVVPAARRDLHDVAQRHHIAGRIDPLYLGGYQRLASTPEAKLSGVIIAPAPDGAVALQGDGVIVAHRDLREHIPVTGSLIADHIQLEEALVSDLIGDHNIGKAGAQRGNEAAVKAHSRHVGILGFKLQLPDVGLIGPLSIGIEAKEAKDGIDIDLHRVTHLDRGRQNGAGVGGNGSGHIRIDDGGILDNGIIVDRRILHRAALAIRDLKPVHLQISAAAILQNAGGQVLVGVCSVAQLTVLVLAPGVDTAMLVVIGHSGVAIGSGRHTHDIVDDGVILARASLTGPHKVGHVPVVEGLTAGVIAQLTVAVGAGRFYALVQIPHKAGGTGRDQDRYAFTLVADVLVLRGVDKGADRVIPLIGHCGTVLRDRIIEGIFSGGDQHILILAHTQLAVGSVGAPDKDLALHVDGHHTVGAGGQGNVIAASLRVHGTSGGHGGRAELTAVEGAAVDILAQAEYITAPGQNVGRILIGGNVVCLRRRRQTDLYRLGGLYPGAGDRGVELTIAVRAHAVDIAHAVQHQGVAPARRQIYDLSPLGQQIIQRQQGGQIKVLMIHIRLKAQLAVTVIAPDKDLALCGKSQNKVGSHSDLLHRQILAGDLILPDNDLLGRGDIGGLGNDGVGIVDVALDQTIQTQAAIVRVTKAPHSPIVPQDHSEVLSRGYPGIGNTGYIPYLFRQRHGVQPQEAMILISLGSGIGGNDIGHAKLLLELIAAVVAEIVHLDVGKELSAGRADGPHRRHLNGRQRVAVGPVGIAGLHGDNGHIGIQGINAQAAALAGIYLSIFGGADQVEAIGLDGLEPVGIQPQALTLALVVFVEGQALIPLQSPATVHILQTQDLGHVQGMQTLTEANGDCGMGLFIFFHGKGPQTIAAVIAPSPDSAVLLDGQVMAAVSAAAGGDGEHITQIHHSLGSHNGMGALGTDRPLIGGGIVVLAASAADICGLARHMDHRTGLVGAHRTQIGGGVIVLAADVAHVLAAAVGSLDNCSYTGTGSAGGAHVGSGIIVLTALVTLIGVRRGHSLYQLDACRADMSLIGGGIFGAAVLTDIVHSLLLRLHNGADGVGRQRIIIAQLTVGVVAPGIDLAAEPDGYHMVCRHSQPAHRLFQLDLTGNRGMATVVTEGIAASALHIGAAQLTLVVITKGPDGAVLAQDRGHVAAGVDPPGVIDGALHGDDLAGHVGRYAVVPVQELGGVGGGSAVTQLAIAVIAPGIDTAVTVHSHDMRLAGGHGGNALEIDRGISVGPDGLIQNAAAIVIDVSSLAGQDLDRSILGLHPLLGNKAVKLDHIAAAVDHSQGLGPGTGSLVNAQHAPGISAEGVDIAVPIHRHGEVTARGDIHDLSQIISLALLTGEDLLGHIHTLVSLVAETNTQLTILAVAPSPDGTVSSQGQNMVGSGGQLGNSGQIIALVDDYLSRRLRIGLRGVSRDIHANTQLAVAVAAPGPDSSVGHQGCREVVSRDHHGRRHYAGDSTAKDLHKVGGIAVTILHFQPLHHPAQTVANGDNRGAKALLSLGIDDPILIGKEVAVGGGQGNILHLACHSGSAVKQIGVGVIIAVDRSLIHHQDLAVGQDHLVGQGIPGAEGSSALSGVGHIGHIPTLDHSSGTAAGQLAEGIPLQILRINRGIGLDDRGRKPQVGVGAYGNRHQRGIVGIPAAKLIGVVIDTRGVHGSGICQVHGEAVARGDHALGAVHYSGRSRFSGVVGPLDLAIHDRLVLGVVGRFAIERQGIRAGIELGKVAPLLGGKGVVDRAVAQLAGAVIAPGIGRTVRCHGDGMVIAGSNVFHIPKLSHIRQLHRTNAGGSGLNPLAQLSVYVAAPSVDLSVRTQSHGVAVARGHGGSLNPGQGPVGGHSAAAAQSNDLVACGQIDCMADSQRRFLHNDIGDLIAIAVPVDRVAVVARSPYRVGAGQGEVAIDQRTPLIHLISGGNDHRPVPAGIDSGPGAHAADIAGIRGGSGSAHLVGAIQAPGIDLSVYRNGKSVIRARRHVDDIPQEVVVAVAVLGHYLHRDHLAVTGGADAQLAIGIVAPCPNRAVCPQGHREAVARDHHGLGKAIVLHIRIQVGLLFIAIDKNGKLLDRSACQIGDRDHCRAHSVLHGQDGVNAAGHHSALGIHTLMDGAHMGAAPARVYTGVEHAAHIAGVVGDLHQAAVSGYPHVAAGLIGRHVEHIQSIASGEVDCDIVNGHTLAVGDGNGILSGDVHHGAVLLVVIHLHGQGPAGTGLSHGSGHAGAGHLGRIGAQLSTVVISGGQHKAVIPDHYRMVLPGGDEADILQEGIVVGVVVNGSYTLVGLSPIAQLAVGVFAPSVDLSVLCDREGSGLAGVDRRHIVDGLILGIIGGQDLGGIAAVPLISHAQTSVVVIAHGPHLSILSQEQGVDIAGGDVHHTVVVTEGVEILTQDLPRIVGTAADIAALVGQRHFHAPLAQLAVVVVAPSIDRAAVGQRHAVASAGRNGDHIVHPVGLVDLSQLLVAAGEAAHLGGYGHVARTVYAHLAVSIVAPGPDLALVVQGQAEVVAGGHSLQVSKVDGHTVLGANADPGRYGPACPANAQLAVGIVAPCPQIAVHVYSQSVHPPGGDGLDLHPIAKGDKARLIVFAVDKGTAKHAAAGSAPAPYIPLGIQRQSKAIAGSHYGRNGIAPLLALNHMDRYDTDGLHLVVGLSLPDDHGGRTGGSGLGRYDARDGIHADHIIGGITVLQRVIQLISDGTGLRGIPGQGKGRGIGDRADLGIQIQSIGVANGIAGLLGPNGGQMSSCPDRQSLGALIGPVAGVDGVVTVLVAQLAVVILAVAIDGAVPADEHYMVIGRGTHNGAGQGIGIQNVLFIERRLTGGHPQQILAGVGLGRHNDLTLHIQQCKGIFPGSDPVDPAEGIRLHLLAHVVGHVDRGGVGEIQVAGGGNAGHLGGIRMDSAVILAPDPDLVVAIHRQGEIIAGLDGNNAAQRGLLIHHDLLHDSGILSDRTHAQLADTVVAHGPHRAVPFQNGGVLFAQSHIPYQVHLDQLTGEELALVLFIPAIPVVCGGAPHVEAAILRQCSGVTVLGRHLFHAVHIIAGVLTGLLVDADGDRLPALGIELLQHLAERTLRGGAGNGLTEDHVSRTVIGKLTVGVVTPTVDHAAMDNAAAGVLGLGLLQG